MKLVGWIDGLKYHLLLVDHNLSVHFHSSECICSNLQSSYIAEVKKRAVFLAGLSDIEPTALFFCYL